jgi:hypothetical protein
MSTVTVTNWGMNLVVSVTFLSLVAVLGDAGTFWLYGVIAIAAWIFFYRLVRKPMVKRWNRLKRTCDRASTHGDYEKAAGASIHDSFLRR